MLVRWVWLGYSLYISAFIFVAEQISQPWWRFVLFGGSVGWPLYGICAFDCPRRAFNVCIGASLSYLAVELLLCSRFALRALPTLAADADAPASPSLTIAATVVGALAGFCGCAALAGRQEDRKCADIAWWMIDAFLSDDEELLLAR